MRTFRKMNPAKGLVAAAEILLCDNGSRQNLRHGRRSYDLKKRTGILGKTAVGNTHFRKRLTAAVHWLHDARSRCFAPHLQLGMADLRQAIEETQLPEGNILRSFLQSLPKPG